MLYSILPGLPPKRVVCLSSKFRTQGIYETPHARIGAGLVNNVVYQIVNHRPDPIDPQAALMTSDKVGPGEPETQPAGVYETRSVPFDCQNETPSSAGITLSGCKLMASDTYLD